MGRISAVGVRYGSVVYFGFGAGVRKRIVLNISANVSPVEIEFGADDWVLLKSEKELLDSKFTDVELVRKKLARWLLGRRVLDIELFPTHSTVKLDEGWVLSSRLKQSPASGFLYSFHVEGGPSWETVDGISVVNRTTQCSRGSL